MATIEFSTDMAAAPKDEQIIVLVPTGNDAHPIAQEMAHWVDEDEENETPARFDGEWRYVDAAYGNNEPIAWASLPKVPPEIEALAREVGKAAA